VNIYYSDRFAKDYRRLPTNIKSLAEEKETIFRQNQNDPRLKTHKLKGRLKKYYSFSVNYQYRIVFHFQSDTDIIFDTIGTHAIYK